MWVFWAPRQWFSVDLCHNQPTPTRVVVHCRVKARTEQVLVVAGHHARRDSDAKRQRALCRGGGLGKEGLRDVQGQVL